MSLIRPHLSLICPVILQEALRGKPECDDQYGCPKYVLSGMSASTPTAPSNIYTNPAHAFPGFCGQHQVLV
jgi:hypothetical protein